VAAAPQPLSSSASTETEASPTPASAAPVTVSDESAAEATETGATSETESAVPEPVAVTYRTRRGDTLWSIARRYGTTVQTLRTLNGLKSSRLVVGQVITLPNAATADGS
jgi:LysM repeat protein